ncbi:MAG: primosomal protein N' [Gammaproteobacteria bacterium]|nr:primosomal protein N' [Gammaproteobacteria bacterium]MCI0591290.1 primosomal protein N' [Gammaproteobacteria bacterium]
MAVLQVALPAPLRHYFDYLPPPNCDIDRLIPGVRLRVPFGSGHRVGMLMSVTDKTELAREQLKWVSAVVDDEPLLSAPHLAFLKWAGDYYHHPIGETVFACLPSLLRKGRPARQRREIRWRLSPEGCHIKPDSLRRAPRQVGLLEFLRQYPEGVTRKQLSELGWGWRTAIRALMDRGWVDTYEYAGTSQGGRGQREPALALNVAQEQAVSAICSSLGTFQPFLLDGVTGSGKTEVYLQVIDRVIREGKQALVLIPEIGLTPQAVDRFRRRFAVPIAVVHSALSDQERLNAWLMARDGSASIVIGTRSAVWTPLRYPGAIIVDEEHDLSYKQHEGFRYSARDLAVVRAQRAKIPVLLGTATPSLESLYNVDLGRYRHLILPERAGDAASPKIEVLDMRRRPMHAALSVTLLEAIRTNLNQGRQVLLFLNRRGFAPAMLCHHCGWVAGCKRCDVHVTYHKERDLLVCHHCGADRRPETSCPSCGGCDLIAVGHGTERLAQLLEDLFPQNRVVRIDRDSTRRKRAMQEMLDTIQSGSAGILIGTQMLAKGHHFPNVTLVGVVDADSGLFGADFRSSERMAQLVMQVAGRAGRAKRPGTVFIQTHHPDHHLLRSLIEHGYGRFAREALVERREAKLPPYTRLTLLRADAHSQGATYNFLSEARIEALKLAKGGIDVFGPVRAPIERRAGRYRGQLLIQAHSRNLLQRMLNPWVHQVENLKTARKVRWSLDVDPQEML